MTDNDHPEPASTPSPDDNANAICPTCGAAMRAAARFCGSCGTPWAPADESVAADTATATRSTPQSAGGAPVDAEQAPPSDGDATEVLPRPASRGSGRRRAIVVAAAAVAAAALVSVGSYLALSGGDDRPADGSSFVIAGSSGGQDDARPDREASSGPTGDDAESATETDSVDEAPAIPEIEDPAIEPERDGIDLIPPDPPSDAASANAWPVGTAAWTVFLTSKSTRTEAQDLLDSMPADLWPAGILHSSDYPDLNPGYWVVYSGIFDSREGASEHTRAIENLYPGSYPRFVDG